MALHNRGGLAQIVDTTVGARTNEHGVHGDVLDRHAWLQTHVCNRTFGGGALGGVGDLARLRHGGGDRQTLAGVGAPRHIWTELGGVNIHHLVEYGIVIGLQRLPVRHGLIPQLAFRRVRTALQVLERGLVRRDHAGTRTGLDGHVAHGHALVHGEVANRLTTVFDHVTLAAAGADLGDDRQNDVLGRRVRGQLAVDVDGHGLERLQRQRLCGHHVFDFGSADAERQRAERAVRRRMRITAHDGHARLGQAQNRGERVDDALIGVAQRVQAHAELLAVLLQSRQLQRARLIRVRAIDINGRRVVILGGNELIHVTRLAAGQAQALKRLRAGDLMHEHQIDVQQIRGSVAALAHQMIGPDLLGQCRSHSDSSKKFRARYCVRALFVVLAYVLAMGPAMSMPDIEIRSNDGLNMTRIRLEHDLVMTRFRSRHVSSASTNALSTSWPPCETLPQFAISLCEMA